MIDISEILDNGTNLPKTWKTLTRELLLKFEDGAIYRHDNIAGCRPYHVDLRIAIDDCVDDDEYKRLHDRAKRKEANCFLYHEVFLELLDIVGANDLMTDELKENLEELGMME